MDALLSGLITLLNGFLAMVGALASPITLGLIILAGSLAWFARLEIDEVNRQSAKPEIGRH